MIQTPLAAQVTQTLRAQGGRMTAQRRLILDLLQESDSHPTAEELYALARQSDPSLNLSTVYRTLNWLEERGFVSRLHDGALSLTSAGRALIRRQ